MACGEKERGVFVCARLRARLAEGWGCYTENFSFTFIPGHLSDTCACVLLHKCVCSLKSVCVRERARVSASVRAGDERMRKSQENKRMSSG